MFQGPCCDKNSDCLCDAYCGDDCNDGAAPINNAGAPVYHSCEKNSVSWGFQGYTFFGTPKSWTDALEACQELGGTLAEPRNAKLNGESECVHGRRRRPPRAVPACRPPHGAVRLLGMGRTPRGALRLLDLGSRDPSHHFVEDDDMDATVWTQSTWDARLLPPTLFFDFIKEGN